MDEETVNELDTAAQPENTAKALGGQWQDLKRTEKRHVNIDVKTVTTEELAPILRRCYGELKTFGRKALTPSSLVGQSRNPARADTAHGRTVVSLPEQTHTAARHVTERRRLAQSFLSYA